MLINRLLNLAVAVIRHFLFLQLIFFPFFFSSGGNHFALTDFYGLFEVIRFSRAPLRKPRTFAAFDIFP